MRSVQQDVDERTSLTGNNKFELFLFKLGTSDNSTSRELFGINVFKVREIMEMPQITAVAGSHPHMLGVVNIRGQIVPVIDLPSAVGCHAAKGLKILMVTEFARSTQAFAVEEVDEIVRLEWNQVMSAEMTGGGLITSIARLDGDVDNTRLAQVLDVEQILRNVLPSNDPDVNRDAIGTQLTIAPGSVILAADDSQLARSLIEQGLTAMGVPFIMTKTGKEAWERLQAIAEQAKAEGKSVKDRVALMLTDLEMPEMDGFTLTRNIKADPRFAGIPVVIHSSLTGTTNEGHIRGVGADAYVAKFEASELAATIRKVLGQQRLPEGSQAR